MHTTLRERGKKTLKKLGRKSTKGHKSRSHATTMIHDSLGLRGKGGGVEIGGRTAETFYSHAL